jgi:hypothetical protein
MLSSQLDQEERRSVLDNDRRVREQQREQGSTYLDHTHDLAGGRYAAISNPTVVGRDAPITNYPAAAPHQFDPCGPEPPLGLDNPALSDPVELSSCTQQATGPTSDAPSPLGQRDVGPLSSFGDPAVVSFPSHPVTSSRREAGSSPLRRRKL